MAGGEIKFTGKMLESAIKSEGIMPDFFRTFATCISVSECSIFVFATNAHLHANVM